MVETFEISYNSVIFTQNWLKRWNGIQTELRFIGISLGALQTVELVLAGGDVGDGVGVVHETVVVARLKG